MSDAETCILLAEYLAANADLAVLGTRLAAKYDDATSSKWNEQESADFSKGCDKIMAIWRKLPLDKTNLVKAATLVLRDLCNGVLLP